MRGEEEQGLALAGLPISAGSTHVNPAGRRVRQQECVQQFGAPYFANPAVVAAILSVFLFVYSYKPSEPHLTRFLRDRGYSRHEINDIIYPVGTYAYLPCLALGGAAAQILTYRGTILVLAGARIGTRILLIASTTVGGQQLAEVLYSMGTAAEALFYAYTYTTVPPAHFPQVTAAVQGTYLAVHVAAGLSGDAMLHGAGWSLYTLMVLSSVGVFLAILFGLACLPSQKPWRRGGGWGNALALCTCQTAWVEACLPPTTLYGPNTQAAGEAGRDAVTPPAPAPSTWRMLVHVYTNPAFLPLCLWWAVIGDPTFQNVNNYESSLYDALLPAGGSDYNGSYSALTLLLGAGAAYSYSLPAVRSALQLHTRPLRLAALSTLLAGLLALSSAGPQLVQGAAARTALCMVSLVLFYGAYALANAAYFNLAGQAVAAAVAAEGGGVGGGTPPFFIVFTLNTCVSVAVQSITTWGLFQQAATPVPPAYLWFGAMMAASVPPLLLLAWMRRGGTKPREGAAGGVQVPLLGGGP